jgi:hypothetical protein
MVGGVRAPAGDLGTGARTHHAGRPARRLKRSGRRRAIDRARGPRTAPNSGRGCHQPKVPGSDGERGAATPVDAAAARPPVDSVRQIPTKPDCRSTLDTIRGPLAIDRALEVSKSRLPVGIPVSCADRAVCRSGCGPSGRSVGRVSVARMVRHAWPLAPRRFECACRARARQRRRYLGRLLNGASAGPSEGRHGDRPTNSGVSLG